jgi:hypothetical protein
VVLPRELVNPRKYSRQEEWEITAKGLFNLAVGTIISSLENGFQRES